VKGATLSNAASSDSVLTLPTAVTSHDHREDDVGAALASLVMACTEEEVREAILAAMSLRHVPAVADEISTARGRLKDFTAQALNAAVVAKRNKGEPLCAICMEGRRSYTSVPCGHRHVCERCSGAVMTKLILCPTCRREFTDVIRVSFD
jgi:hypothetical protein